MVVQSTINALIDSTIDANLADLADPDRSADRSWQMWHQIGTTLHNNFLVQLSAPLFIITTKVNQAPINESTIRNTFLNRSADANSRPADLLFEFVEEVYNHYVAAITTVNGTSLANGGPIVVNILPSYHDTKRNIMRTVIERRFENMSSGNFDSISNVKSFLRSLAEVLYMSSIHTITPADYTYTDNGVQIVPGPLTGPVFS